MNNEYGIVIFDLETLQPIYYSIALIGAQGPLQLCNLLGTQKLKKH